MGRNHHVHYATSKTKRNKADSTTQTLVTFLALGLLVISCSWGVTFPSETLVEQVETILKDEYKLDTQVRVMGDTIGVMHTMDKIISDDGAGLHDDFRERIGNLILTATRAALSTDIELNFVVVLIRGAEELIEIQVTRYLTDVKRSYTSALGDEEAMSRTLWDQAKVSPGDIERNIFNMEDVEFEDFLTKQITQRVNVERNKEKAEEEDAEEAVPGLPTELIEGYFRDSPEGRAFEFAVVSFVQDPAEETVMRMFRTISKVLDGYTYQDFDYITVKDLLSRKILSIDRATFNQFRLKKLTEAEILDLGFHDDMTEPGRFKNAIEIFGRNLQ